MNSCTKHNNKKITNLKQHITIMKKVKEHLLSSKLCGTPVVKKQKLGGNNQVKIMQETYIWQKSYNSPGFRA